MFVKIIESISLLNGEQRLRFLQYLPDKVYKTEKNISIIVALSQIVMIILFLLNDRISLSNPHYAGYFGLYFYLLIATIASSILHTYLYNRKKFDAFMWLRRIYSFLICFWVIGVSYLELSVGKGIGVYCYLAPTMAAVLMMTPLESVATFGFTWATLVYFIITESGQYIDFGNIVNSTFVTILTFFISYRYYRSLAMEFRDKEIISTQYDEIHKSNELLEEMVHMDQLTGLYNRHYLVEKEYPLFEEYRQKGYFGSFLMMDIDMFKQYNDLYGHIQGDRCLMEISEAIRKFCKKEGASAIRYGGEEFLLIKMSSKYFDGQAFAEGLINIIKEANLGRDDVIQKRVTVSVGIWSGALNRLNHIEAAIKLSDDALYESKSNGRDCITFSKE